MSLLPSNHKWTLALLVVLVAGSAGTAAALPEWFTVETGFQVGTPLGTEGVDFPRLRVVSEIGVLEGRGSGPKRYRGRLGAIAYGAISGRDLVLGIKPRLRVDWGRTWSSDFTAGYIFYTVEADPSVGTTGFVGGATLNHGSVYSLKLDVNARRVQPRRTVHRNVPRHHPGGTEVGFWGGVSFREQPGWFATGVVTTILLALTVLVVIAGPS